MTRTAGTDFQALTEGNWKRPMWSHNWLDVPADGPWARLHGLGCPPEGTPILIFECELHTDWQPSSPLGEDK